MFMVCDGREFYVVNGFTISGSERLNGIITTRWDEGWGLLLFICSSRDNVSSTGRGKFCV